MNVSIAHPSTKGRRKRPPVIHSANSDAASGPTPLQAAIAKANAREVKRQRAGRQTARAGVLSESVFDIETLPPSTTEAQLFGYIVKGAREVGGWLIDCKRQGMDAVKTPGGVEHDDWQQVGNGLPDAILIHEARAMLVLWEFKRDKKPSPLREKQVRWRSGLQVIAAMHPNMVSAVISPSDWRYIKAVLRGH